MPQAARLWRSLNRLAAISVLRWPLLGRWQFHAAGGGALAAIGAVTIAALSFGGSGDLPSSSSPAIAAQSSSAGAGSPEAGSTETGPGGAEPVATADGGTGEAETLVAVAPPAVPSPAPAPSLSPEALPQEDQDGQAQPPELSLEGEAQSPPANDRLDLVLRVSRGDTLVKMLTDIGVPIAEAHDAVDALRRLFNPRALQIGQTITVTMATDTESTEQPSLLQLALRPEAERDVSVQRGDDGSFDAKEVRYALTTTRAKYGGIIEDSLFASGQAAGTPVPILQEMIKAFSHDVDFQRDIHPNDSFEVMSERIWTSDGRLAREGKILFAELVLRGKRTAFYRFKPEGGEEEYFSPDGQSIVKALLRTPIDGARLSSGFGMRSHPILGYSRMHAGVDFAAPTGTPIYAAGNGTVEFAGVKSGYGNFIQIRHNNRYATAYAHMSGFARGMRVGQRVRQGEVIGYVGSTGLATGPHLHYEVRVAGKPVNPVSVSMPIGPKLAGKDLARFRELMARIDKERATMPNGPQPQNLVDASKASDEQSLQ